MPFCLVQRADMKGILYTHFTNNAKSACELVTILRGKSSSLSPA